MATAVTIVNDLATHKSYVSFPPPDYEDKAIAGEPHFPIAALWVFLRYPIEKEMSSTYITEIYSPISRMEFAPQTPLGKRLYYLRKKAIASGIRLLSEEEVSEEIMRRRGDLTDDKEDLY
jgi:hypothetical protein